MAFVDKNIIKKDYGSLIQFVKDNDCTVLQDCEMVKYHMVTIETPDDEVAWEIMSDSFLDYFKESDSEC